MMKNVLIVSIIIFSCIMLVALSQVNATTLAEMDLAELTKESEVVFVGMVVSSESAIGTNDNIYTNVLFEINDVIKGIYPELTMNMRLAGGTVGEHTTKYVGMPDFRPGGKHIIFLRGNEKFLCPIVGWDQGKFNVIEDKATGQEIVLDSSNVPITSINGNNIERLPSASSTMESFPGVSEEHGSLAQDVEVDSSKRITLREFTLAVEDAMGVGGEIWMP